MSRPSRALRVAIVGCGPKGLYALERLVADAEGLEGRMSVHVYEPHPTPGAGPVYDPEQPEYLRMNFSADLVDMWPKREHDPARPSFSEWQAGIEGASDEAYPPRALVGRYLADGFRRVVGGAPEGLEIVHLAEKATEVNKAAGGWTVSADGDREYDEVLIATGHAGYAVFPVERNLSRSEVPPGSVVAVRGFALTMIDAALALTEGRGGRFRPGRGPGLLRYERGADEVAFVLPWSRTGRPMLAKPDPAKAVSSPSLDEIASAGRAELASLPPGSSVAAAAQVVAEVAAKSLRSVGAPDGELKAVATHMENAASGRSTPPDSSPADELERSIAVGLGIGEHGADWALGHAWRSVYPAIVERLGAHGLADAEWPAFRHLAAEMERIAFGPPPVNAAKLLALIEDGKVDLSRLTSGPAREADLVLDAVIPPPGALATDSSPVGHLVRAGYATIPNGRRGIELTADVTCVGSCGRPSEGLAAIGRPTEDWIIGNDTLNRGLHPHAEIWARRVVARAVAT